MKLHKEGNKILIFSTLLGGLVAAVIWYFLAPLSLIITTILLLALAIFLLLIFRFFRVPRKSCPQEAGVIYAPCDGKVVVIEETEESEYFKDQRIQVSIFMSPLNVHVNYYPSNGSVSYTKYHPGKFLVAWHPKSSTENERSTVVTKNENGIEVLFRQIAGAVARRIITYSKQGDTVKAGEEMGFIKFGSRVDIFLPKGSEILVGLENKTVGAETPIARLA